MKRFVFVFWGVMDLLYLIHFVGFNFVNGRVPILSDLASFRDLNQPLALAGVFIGLSIALTLSVAISAFLFLSGHEVVRKVAFAQAPLRLLLATPSLTFISWLVPGAGSGGPALGIVLLISSEALKIRSLQWVRHCGSKAPSLIGAQSEDLGVSPDPEGLTPIASRVRYGQRQEVGRRHS